ncbi:hypothetical protein HDU93_006487, partial [Gonapodya sp. JEL0774]
APRSRVRWLGRVAGTGRCPRPDTIGAGEPDADMEEVAGAGAGADMVTEASTERRDKRVVVAGVLLEGGADDTPAPLKDSAMDPTGWLCPCTCTATGAGAVVDEWVDERLELVLDPP